jgi:adenylosuccinate lyase
VLLALIEKGMSREEAYDLVQPNAMKSWETEKPFKKLVEQDERIADRLTQSEIDACFDETYHLKNVDVIFERLGLND